MVPACGDELKAVLGPPLVEELMGGCSLTCSFPWTAVNGSLALAALNDADPSTAWTGIQAGDRLVFRFPADLPRELNQTPFYGIDLANGRVRPAEESDDYGWVRTIRLLHNNRAVHTIHLQRSRRWQTVEFDDIFLNVGDTVCLEIVAVEPGKKFPAALTEIVLQGAH